MQESTVSSEVLTLLGMGLTLSEDKTGVTLELSAETGNFQRFRRIAELCLEKIPVILPYNNKLDIDFVSGEPERVLDLGDDIRDEQLFKIALMGGVGSGKTLLAKRFAHNIYSPHFKATIGVDFVKRDIVVGATRCQLQVWDLAGTRPDDEMTHIYLRGTSGILLTADLSRQGPYAFSQVISTYERILRDSDFPAIPIMLVGLQSDNKQPESVRKLEALADQLNMPFMLCSARTAENVDAVFDVLSRMIIAQQFPRYVMRLRIKKANQDWFTLSSVYGELTQLVSADVSIMPMKKSYDFKLGLYEAAVQFLSDQEYEGALCKFYIKNYEHDDFIIRRDAIKNINRYKRESPCILKYVIEKFYSALSRENHAIRYEAIQGLRVLGELNSDVVKKICLRQFDHIAFQSTYAISDVIKKLKEYEKPALVKACIRAISLSHADCFSILEEIGEVKSCEDISRRVLQALDNYMKTQAAGPSVSSRQTFGFSRK